MERTNVCLRFDEHDGPVGVRVPEELQSVAVDLARRVLSHPFLARCGDGTVTMRELRSFLIQHGKYSSYFTRYLCALLSHLDSGDDVLKIAQNLAEELGYGDGAQTPHARIYADMLGKFGIIIDRHEIYPETRNLIDTMFMLCRQSGGIAGLGALSLGAEAVVPAIYARLLNGFRTHGVDAEVLRFFTIHVECDDAHAATMYAILAREISASPSSRVVALNAGEIAINARLRFFDAIAKEVH